MKFIQYTFVLLSWSLTVSAGVRIQDFGDREIRQYVVDGIRVEPRLTGSRLFNHVKLEGISDTGLQYELGAPDVPVIRFDVLADQASDIIITTWQHKSNERFQVPDLVPVYESAPKIPGAQPRFTTAPGRRAHFPPFSVERVGSVRVQGLFRVTLRPLTHSENLQTLVLRRSYAVEIFKKPPPRPVRPRDGLLFVVGARYKDSPSLQAYMRLRAQQGLDVASMVLEGEDPKELRDLIRMQYQINPHLKYLVIVGDLEDVPAPEGVTLDSGVTDHYYACVDTEDYVSDIQTPDLKVGRFSVTSEDELAAVLRKYTRYARGEFRTLDWLTQLSFLATDDQWEIAETTHNYAIDTYTSLRGYRGSFPEGTQAGGDRLYAITHRAEHADVLAALTQGRSIINYSGHGATTFWDAPRLTQPDVRALDGGSLPFVVSNACITSDFRLAESFGETWQRQEWGASMFWGSMDSTYWDEDDVLERAMYDAIFRDNKLVFGDLTHYALSRVATHYGGQGRSSYYWETYHMFGDPSLSLRLR